MTATLLSSPARRRGVVALFLLAAAAMAPGLGRLRLDSSPEAYFVEDRDELARYRQLEARFGRDRSLRVVVEGPGLWTAPGLAWLADLEGRLDALPAVLAAAGLSRHLLAERAARALPPREVRRRALGDRIARDVGWVSEDGSAATVLVALPRLDSAGQRSVLARVDSLIATPPPGVRVSVSGLPVVQAALEREALATLQRFFPALVLWTTAVLLALFRRPRHVAALLLFVAVCEVSTLGAMGWAGVSLDLVTVLLVPLLFVVATATGAHLLVRFRLLREHGLDAVAAAAKLVRQKRWPVVWGGLTTAAGFGSLALARVPAVARLGTWGAVGFAWTLVAALALLPGLLAGERGAGDADAPRWTRVWRRRGRRWAATAVRRRRAVYLAFAGAALVATVGAAALRVESHVLGYLPPAHPVRLEIERLEALGLGVVSAELVLALPRGAGSFAEPERLEGLERLAERLRRDETIVGVISAGDVVTAWRRRGIDPALAPAAPSSAGGRAPTRREGLLLGALLAPRGEQTRLSLLLPMAPATELAPVLAAARLEAAAAFPRAEVWVTGRYPLVLRSQDALVPALARSLGAALALVALALGVALRSIGRAVGALVVNLWPILVALGAMGWSGTPLDSATVAVAAVALGLVVDDTFHTLADHRRGVVRRGAARAAVAALERNAPAHASTALLLGGGLALLGLSGFAPAARFGPLTAVAVVAALAADLLLLPALLSGARPPDGLARLAGGGRARARRLSG